MTAGAGDLLAEPGLLRRIELLAAGWTAVGAGAFLMAGSPARALVLTGASAASIVAFRGLQRIVSAIGPRDEARDQTPAQRPAQEPARIKTPRSGDAGDSRGRTRLATLVRLGLLGALLMAGSSLLAPEHFPALVLGFSTLPAALMTEGFLQAGRALRGEDHDHHDAP
ncbi:MAG TPA: hypothetical protein VMR44_01780 [Thermoanaerobaculia bacterium]|nr:hypothetical protein [Thermoanaerobaculia bacterium]